MTKYTTAPYTINVYGATFLCKVRILFRFQNVKIVVEKYVENVKNSNFMIYLLLKTLWKLLKM